MAQPNPWTRSAWTDAAQIVELIDDDADVAPASGKSLPEWFSTLLATNDYAAALRFLSHAMSRYDCVVWAVRSVLDSGMADRGNPCVTAALRWIDNPESDDLRRQAGALADEARKITPDKLLAQAVFFSGGSIAPANSAPVQAAPDVCAKFAYSAVLIGAYALADPQAAMRRSLEIGEAMVSGQR